ncbi:MAG: ABC transporter permease subunit [Tenericutes bacterium]|nr:ABC transporter permease subunit [Mycoplasmatota bacterium]
MNIYKFELSRLLRSMLIWGLAVPGFLIFYMAFFPALQGVDNAFSSVIDTMDPKFLAAFGMIPELPIGEIMGYFNLTIGLIMIPLAIQASNYGFHILSVEERELTADFLFTKPISRTKIIVSKFLAALTSLLFVDIIITILSVVSIQLFKGTDSVNIGNVMVLMLSLPFFQLTFMSIGLVISVSIKKVTSVLSFSMALGFGLFVVNSFGSILSSELFTYLTPYSHFNTAYILINGHWDWSIVWISFTIMICSFAATYFLYLKRNIASL